MSTTINFRDINSVNMPNRQIPTRANSARGNSAFAIAGSDMSADMLRARQGETNHNNVFRLSLSGSFASFMETGKIANSDEMEDYSMLHDRTSQLADIARDMFFRGGSWGNSTGVRSMEEMTQLFDERLTALRNADNISDERREMEIEALKRGFVLAVEARFHGTSGGVHLQGTSSGLARFSDSRFSNHQSIGQFAVRETIRILNTGASEEAQNLLFQALESVVLQTSGSISGRDAFEASLRARSEEFDAIEERRNRQNERLLELLAALQEDAQSIRSAAHSIIVAELLTTTQNLLRQWDLA
ncbi:MAG: hypothetical protein FWB96_07640 [Defluviitaleaceae bacterium]|nr:hypothetical protein [Defluviitaleaceae bacterium]MCL2262797.1 hypothetical protein [Defluviitaleaceae bacterium]